MVYLIISWYIYLFNDVFHDIFIYLIFTPLTLHITPPKLNKLINTRGANPEKQKEKFRRKL